MIAVSGFIFLVSVIAHCHSAPLTEFDIDFQAIREKLEHLVKSKMECASNCQVAEKSECQCVYQPSTMDNCTDYQCIEHGLKKLNFTCSDSNKDTYKTCRVLRRLKELVTTEQTMCRTPMAQKPFLEYIKMIPQRSYSQ